MEFSLVYTLEYLSPIYTKDTVRLLPSGLIIISHSSHAWSWRDALYSTTSSTFTYLKGSFEFVSGLN
jgi:hypothetical protein